MLFGFSLCWSGDFVSRERESCPLKSPSSSQKKFWTGIQSNPIRCPSRWSVPRPRRGDQRKRARSSRRTKNEAFDFVLREGMAAMSLGASEASRRKKWTTISRDSSPKEKTATSRLKSRPVPVNGRHSGRTKPRTGRESSS